ncbi:MAG: DUF1211 domain-containing protein [Elusimicrobia bacterium]|nr:DUF1211 domain-containing protein [Elusimicrobiota bacterium]
MSTLSARAESGTQRLEAFSDGVLAIIITIMVLELNAPKGPALADLRPLLPAFLSYLLSFVYLGIYWNNHHSLIAAARRVDGRVLWANLHLLFWLSLVPFATAWMGEHHEAGWPAALYGAVMVMAALAYTILQSAIVADHGPDSELARAVGRDWKGKLSLACYATSVPAAFAAPLLSYAIYVLVALLWLVPDPRLRAGRAK